MPGPTVFLSYSHLDEAWKDRVVKHLGSVASLDLWDDRRIGAGANGRAEIETALAAASAAVLLISADFLSSTFIKDVELPTLFARRAREGVRVIPLVLRPCAWLTDPWLSTLQGRPKDGKPLVEVDENQVERDLSALAQELHELFRAAPRAKAEFVPLPPTMVSLARMPNTREFLFGREEQLGQLDKAWEDPTTRVVTIVAPGGVGKSALVNHWLGQMDQDHYRGAERVWAWSFYSQGSSGQAQSAEEFFREALAEFGDPDPGAGSPFQRGERLAKLVRQARTLLILDGLEPLQHPPGPLGGKLKDPGLVALLKNLAAGNPGLCVVTTREPVAELASREKTTAPKIDLRTLSDEAGAALLRELGVHGSEKELRQAAREFGGHSLAILLLGNFLRQVCDGDVKQRDKVKLLEQDAEEGGHASRVLAAYESWLGEGKELSILRLLGLFDRPAEADSLEALRAEPAIPGLTEALFPRDEDGWKRALDRLLALGLLAPGGGDEALDTHPLVRTYFGEQLRKHHPDAWKEGNLRLYEHLKAKAPDLPETFAQMGPLYAAVIHGCRAGKQPEALTEVFKRRIQRGAEFYSNKMLGAVGAELAALSGFFNRPWDQPNRELTSRDRSILLNEASLDLRALGRLAEAVGPMQSGLEMDVQEESWPNAAISAKNLSELTLTLGDLAEAVTVAERSVDLADRSGNEFQRMTSRTALADALHQAGQENESERLFREAEALQSEQRADYSLLSSLQGYQYCDLLLSRIETRLAEVKVGFYAEATGQLIGATQSVLERAEWSIQIAARKSLLLDIALAHLTLGRAYYFSFLFYLEFQPAAGEDPAALAQHARSKAAEHLDQAVEGLRSAATEEFVPRGLLSRAAFYRTQADYPAATTDLDEALEIAERGGMRLQECDAHLEWARLCRAMDDLPAAREHLAKATALVAATGYHRRDREVAALERQLAEGD